MYCSSCGSSLQQRTTPPPTSVVSQQGQGYGMMGTSSYDTPERFARALSRVEQLGIAVIILAIITLILVFA